MSGAFKFSIITVFIFLFSACTEIKDELEIFKDDAELDLNDRTLDVTIDRAQPIAYGFIQSSLRSFLYLPVFDFLDSSDIPETALLVDSEYIFDCEFGGQAFYTTARPDGEEYREGDKFSVRYEDCVRSVGMTYNGSIALTYSELTGLNETFALNTTQRCSNNIADTFDAGYQVYENIDADGEFFWADDVRFVPVGSGLEIQFLKWAPAGEIGDTSVVATQRASNRAIVILRALEVDEDRAGEDEVRYKIIEGVYPSLGGDKLFRLSGDSWSQEACQEYGRTARLTTANLTVALSDGVTFRMAGSTRIFQSSEFLTHFSERMYDSNFSLWVTQGNDERRYKFGEEYSVAKGVDEARNSYSYSVEGGMTFDGGGYGELVTTAIAYGTSRALPPSSGTFQILAQGVEEVNIRFRSEVVQLAFDYDGDNDGDGLTDSDFAFDVFWYDLLDQNYQEVE
jgi:hypothetical protein